MTDRSLFTPAPQRSRPGEPPEAVTEIVRHLRLDDVALLRRVSPSTICAAVDELHLPAASRAAIDLWLKDDAPQSTVVSDGTTALAEAVERQRLGRIFPWLAAEEAALRQMERFRRDWTDDPKQAKEALRSEFASKAKNNTLGALESLVGQYCLYCTDAEFGGYLLMSLLLRIPTQSRITVHNWMVANDMPRATKEAYGVAIANLSTPLFPPCAGLEAANTKLLDAALVMPAHGGDTDTSPRGGGHLALTQVDGNWVADSTPVEHALNALQQQINSLAAQRRGVKSQPPPYANPPPRYAQYAQRTYRRGPRGSGPGLAEEDDPALDALFPSTLPQPTTPPPSTATVPKKGKTQSEGKAGAVGSPQQGF